MPACQFKVQIPNAAFRASWLPAHGGRNSASAYYYLSSGSHWNSNGSKNSVVNLHWRAILLEKTAIFQLKLLNL